MSLRPSRLQIRFAFVAVLVVSFALGMAVFLNYYKYQKSLSGLLKDRVSVIGLSVQTALENGTALGLDLRDLPTANALIAREKKLDTLVRDIVVVGRDGTDLYSTGAETRGQKAPESWRTAIAAALKDKDARWSASDSMGEVVGIPVHNAFSLVVGYVVLRYDDAYARAKTSRMGVALGTNAVEVGTIAVVVALIGLGFVLRRLIGDLHAAEPPLDALAAGDVAAPIRREAIDHPLEREIVAFADTLGQANRALDHVAALAEGRA